MTSRNVTIFDVAAEVGLSKSTVSNVLRDTGRFSDETRSAVLEAARRLGYVANRAARSLRDGRPSLLGLYIPPSMRFLPYYMEFAFGAAAAAERAGADLALLAHRGPRSSRYNVDGAIVVDPRPDEQALDAMLEQNIPVVTAGAYSGTGADRIAGVIDVDQAPIVTRALAPHLPTARRAALLLADRPGTVAWAGRVHSAFFTECAAAGVEATDIYVDEALSSGSVSAAVDAADDFGADLIVCAAETLAGQCKTLLEYRGRAVGTNPVLVSTVASDAELADATYTRVALHPYAFGDRAVSLLVDVLNGDAERGTARWFDAARIFPPGDPGPRSTESAARHV